MSGGPNNRGNFKHGHATKSRGMTKPYRIWKGMRRRCQDKNDHAYPGYGGRGIKVCDRWQKFENFYADMGDPPSDRSLDRINNDGDYELENCRWATRHQQSNNSRNIRLLTVGTETLSVRAWARKIGICAFPAHQPPMSRLERGESCNSTDQGNHIAFGHRRIAS